MSQRAVMAIETESDIVKARQEGRALAKSLGFSLTECTLIATAISEVARNIIEYASEGEIELARVCETNRKGIRIVARDHGPGIADPELAMNDGYSTGGSLGMGLPGAKRLMDTLELSSTPGGGVTVTMTRWAQ